MGRRGDALARGAEGDEEAGNGEEGEEADREGPSAAGIAVAEMADEGEGEALDDKLRHAAGDEADGVEAGALADVGREHAAQRRIGGVVERIDGEQQHIGDGGIESHGAGIADARMGECQDVEQAEGQGRPQQPRAVLAPAGAGAVGNDAHQGVDKGGEERGDEQHQSGNGTIESEDIGVELQLIDHHHLKSQVGTHVTKRIAYLLAELDFGVVHRMQR